MARNVEIKARLSINEFESAQKISARIASEGPEVIQQTDTYFDCRTGRLKLRQFADGSAELIAYQRPDAVEPKTSNYHLIDCPTPQRMIEGLTSVLGLRNVVKKRRVLFLVGQTRIHLDQVEGLGCFLELEVVLQDSDSESHGRAVANEILAQLKIDETQMISGSYIDLMDQHATPN
jgi:predicted adenylyl cyclase CyaB